MQATFQKRWYLVQCKPRQDARALENLQYQGYLCLFPTRQIESLRNGKLSCQEEPLFPGYIFIELDNEKDNWMPIRSTRGVSHIVRFGAMPLQVRNEVIDKFRTPQPLKKAEFNQGEKVVINCLGTNEIDAIFLKKDGAERSVLLLNLLQRELQIKTANKNISRAN
ncbi:transcriptional antiterminator RfaH [Pseudomonas nitritireducens]|uniref:Transcriptional antiterminator RfaH n=1 Tax=Pseudomonas nitroreducens TaxID=46680 RepID=A0A7W7KQ44_PSENT|nr:transcription/translation regulatory transformer protein RfaH [Pseudomonas nitritireducens]MBB4866413.1 transcriptional antiterminator RfaH [Pseudomonas nitritireducens]